MAAPKLEPFRDHKMMIPTETAGVTIETVRIHRPTVGQYRAVLDDPDAPIPFVKDQTGRTLSSADLDQMVFEDFDAINQTVQDFLPLRLRPTEGVSSSLSQPSSPQNSPASATPSPSTSEQQ